VTSGTTPTLIPDREAARSEPSVPGQRLE
jgi:hypothetical protein